jgi:hypothetical protein
MQVEAVVVRGQRVLAALLRRLRAESQQTLHRGSLPRAECAGVLRRGGDQRGEGGSVQGKLRDGVAADQVAFDGVAQDSKPHGGEQSHQRGRRRRRQGMEAQGTAGLLGEHAVEGVGVQVGVVIGES